MSKLLKVLLISAYVSVLYQYIKFSLSSVEEIIEINYNAYFNGTAKKYFRKILFKYMKNLTAMQIKYKQPKRFATDFKYILKYTNSYLQYRKSLYRNGQTAFINHKCKFYNCFLTNDAGMLTDIRNYDAILFDVENIWDSNLRLRAPHQRFIFVASSAATDYPLCDKGFNDYYNLTWTYKLDSDISFTFLSITDKNGTIVGPRVNMTWINPMKATPLDVKEEIATKKTAAAMFLSNCNERSNSREIARGISKELLKYNLTMDIFGYCGTRTCPGNRFDDCLALLKRNYYFYLSFETTLCEDFVTEKVLYALQHFTVPVVYGGADYSRFLPPGSYINAGLMNATEVAHEMYLAINNHSKYEDYFKWHNYYNYISTVNSPNVCDLCEVLNQSTDKPHSYKNFLRWWNPYYVHICSAGVGRVLIQGPHNALKLEQHMLHKDPDDFDLL